MDRRDKKTDTRIRLTLPETPAVPEERRDRGGMTLIPVLVLVLVVLFFFSLLFIVPYRQWSFSLAYLFESVRGRFAQLYAFFTGASSEFGVTVYQYLAVSLAGAALAACGAIFQGSFRNVLAGPSTMGVMAGGTLGCLLYLLLFTSASGAAAYTTADLDAWAARSFFQTYQRQIFTLLGCFGGVALVLGVGTAAGRGRLSAPAMVLSGTVFSAITREIGQLIQYYMILKDPADPRIDAVSDLMMGSFNGINGWQPLLLMGVPIVLCLGVLLLLRRRMNLLLMSEDEALTIGVNIRAYRYVMVAAGTVLTAVVVAFCGHIGFLGFMIPLVGRRLVGPDMARLLPVSLLVGAILLTLVFDAAYIAGMTDYLNVFTSAIGGAVMLVTLLRKGGGAVRAPR